MKSNPTTSAQSIRSTPTAAAPRKRGAWRKYVPYGVGAVLLVLIVTALLPKPLEIEAVAVSTGPLTVSVLEEGKTRIRHRYVVSPPLTGFLRRLELRAGDRIEAGKTVLALIQPQPASFLDPRARAEAEARMRGAEAAKAQRETQIERARVALDWAEKEFARARELKKSGAISTKEWDSAQNQVEALTRELHTAVFALQVAEFERAQAEAALMQAKNPGAEGAEPLPITAPVSGFVLNVYEESARILPAGTPIMEVGDPTDLECEIELLSSDAVGVQAGAEVSIEQWGGDAPLRGKVALVEPGGFMKVSALGVEEQRVKVRVNFDEAFPPGRSMGDRFRVEARIVTWRGDRVLQVPTGALFRRGGDWMTFLLEGGKARLTKVQIAHNNGVAAEVRSGLSEGQRVILHPPDAVADGAAVSVRK
jgi:HlyD family secretion protein